MTMRGYINGEQFGLKNTEDWSNGTLILIEGTEIYHYFKFWGEHPRQFHGDLFKFNIYNRALMETEIKNMASMCTCEEDKLASAKILEWEQLLNYANEYLGFQPEISNFTGVVEFDAEEIVPTCVSIEAVIELVETKKQLGLKDHLLEKAEQDMEEKEQEMEKRKQDLESTKLEL